MRKVVIYPGRFHPFHKGHKSVYDYLVKKYGAPNVYVVSSGTQAPMTSPFSFADKKVMMKALGVPGSQIVQVKSPYQPREVTEKFDSETTAVIFAVSEKDSERFNFKPKKDGSPSYMQPLGKKLEPMNTHGYVELVPTATFSINGNDINSASQIRAMYMNSDDEGRMNIISELYGRPDEKIKRIFDTELKLAESILRVKKYAPLMESSFGTAFNRIMREVNESETIVEAEMQVHEIITEGLKDPSVEETYDGDAFFEAYGEIEETLTEAEYQGRKVQLNKPMRGDVKKFKVYVKNEKGNVVKVNFGDPDMKIRKSNPKARKSFRARHNCDNPGPKTKARYWSCRKW